MLKLFSFVLPLSLLIVFSGCEDDGGSSSDESIDVTEYIFVPDIEDTYINGYLYSETKISQNFDVYRNGEYFMNESFDYGSDSVDYGYGEVLTLESIPNKERYFSLDDPITVENSEDGCTETVKKELIEISSEKSFSPQNSQETISFTDVIAIETTYTTICDGENEVDNLTEYYAKGKGMVYSYDRDCIVDDEYRDNNTECDEIKVHEMFYVEQE